MLRRISIVSLLIALAGACGGADDGATVDMAAGQSFEPERVTVDAGQTVVFSNTSDESHTVTAYGDDLPDGADYFASGDFPDEEAARDSVSEGLLEAGDEYEVTLTEPGTYTYFCIPHESAGMKGTIVVAP